MNNYKNNYKRNNNGFDYGGCSCSVKEPTWSCQTEEERWGTSIENGNQHKIFGKRTNFGTISDTFGTINDKCYTTISNDEMENNNVSLVGLFKCANGIIGIGDYKSTCSVNKIEYSENNRNAKKVFKNNHFILVTFGTNKIIKGNNIVNLEDVLEKIVSCSSDINNFRINFMSEVSGISSKYNFLFGEKIGDEYMLGSLIINGLNFEKTYDFGNCWYAGDEKYHSVMAKLSIDPRNDVETVALKLEKALKSLIEFYSVEDVYQSVGTNDKGEVLIEIFK